MPRSTPRRCSDAYNAMRATGGSPRQCSEHQRYEVRVQGHLDSRWANWLHGLTVRREHDGTTTLTGPLVDQAALHGLLTQIRDLGLPIVSMRRLCPESEGSEGGQATVDRGDAPA